MQVIDLFSGIGGFSLAAHWAGWHTVQFCERDPFCVESLKLLFPGIPINNDVFTLTYEEIKKGIYDESEPTIICGGFPCQPFSVAGKQEGTDDERYLWPAMFEVIRSVKPEWVVAENVRGLLNIEGGMVFEQVHSDLESEGYEVQAFVIPAVAVDAPHERYRLWFVAKNARRDGCIFRGHGERGGIGNERNSGAGNEERIYTESRVADTENTWPIGRNGIKGDDARSCESRNDLSGRRCGNDGNEDAPNTARANDGRHTRKPNKRQIPESGISIEQGIIADTEKTECNRIGDTRNRRDRSTDGGIASPDTDRPGRGEQRQHFAIRQEHAATQRGSWSESWYEVATELCRMDDGLPAGLDKSERATIYAAIKTLGRSETEKQTGLDLSKVDPWRADRLKALGNSIVPQVAYEIFKAINEVENQLHPINIHH